MDDVFITALKTQNWAIKIGNTKILPFRLPLDKTIYDHNRTQQRSTDFKWWFTQTNQPTNAFSHLSVSPRSSIPIWSNKIDCHQWTSTNDWIIIIKMIKNYRAHLRLAWVIYSRNILMISMRASESHDKNKYMYLQFHKHTTHACISFFLWNRLFRY